tara:strand:- start:3905 stop:4954 length:1050 start_codon:yes stop_codon:yes gene_type:complete
MVSETDFVLSELSISKRVPPVPTTDLYSPLRRFDARFRAMVVGQPTTNSRKRADEARAFAASAATAQREITKQFQLNRGGPASSRVPKSASGSSGYFEVFPRTATSGKSKPVLLEDLERLLHEKLRLGRKLSGTHGSTSDGSENENDTLDAHRQTFDAFIDAFTTYKPLLVEIKTTYDRALDRALQSERACAGLRAEIKASERRRLAEIRNARADTMTKAANVRGDAVQRMAAAEVKVAAAKARALEAEAEMARWRAHAEAADARAAEAEQVRAALKRRMDAETSWATSRGDAAKYLLASEMPPVPDHFARVDVQLVEGEGGLHREQPEAGQPGEEVEVGESGEVPENS